MVGVSLLGPVEVVLPHGRQPVPPGRAAELLTRLALDAGAVVTTERLIDELWGDAAGPQARNTVQTTVSRLRRALGDPAAVVGSPTGYRLAVAPAEVDALAVVADAARAADARRAGGPASAPVAREICTAALARFRGEPFTGAGDGAWLVAHRVRLSELRLTLVEWQVEARLELGEAAEVVGPLEELVRLHPRREGLWRSLMTALYRDGRQADALAAYTRLRVHLADELGLLPSPESSRLEQQILGHDPALDHTAAAGAPAAVSPAGGAAPAGAAKPAGNLPTLVSSLVGRDRALAEVEALVGAGHALVTLVGPAGVGKTRLAVEVGRRWAAPGGACLARLEAAHDRSGVVQAVAEALGVAEASETAVGQWLASSDGMLLILDNCEQVTGEVGALVGRLLRAAPATRVLCTSQLPLGLEGEETFPVDPLAVDDAAALFVDRARRWRRRPAVGSADAASDGADASGGADDVVALCRALDGLPLAIELAAARSATLPVAEITRRLDDRFALLHDPTGRRVGRHQALRTALAWSYDLLAPDDQRLLQLLALFPGGAPLAGVEAVAPALGASHGGPALDGLGRLVDRSLVTAAIEGGNTRYHLLDSVRAFALDRLASQAEVAAGLRRAQAAWYADLADAAAAGLRGPAQGSHLAIARRERANLGSALDWAAGHDPALGLSIANGFGWAWFLLGDGPAGAERLRLAREAAERAGVAAPVERAHNLSLAAWLGSANDIVAARADAEAALALAATIDERAGHRCRVALAFVQVQQRRPDEVLTTLEPLLGPSAPAGVGEMERDDRWYGAAAWRLAAHAWLVLGDPARAGEAGGRAEALLAGIGDDWALAHLANLRGVLATTAGRHGEATAHLRSAVDASARLGFRAAQALHLTNLARSLELGGEAQAAAATYREAADTALAARDLRIAALARTGLGRLLLSRGDRTGAEEAITAADRWFAGAGGGEGALLAGALAAALAAEAGDPGAPARLEELAARARVDGDHEAELVALDALTRHRAASDPS